MSSPYKHGETKYRKCADGKWRCYIFSALTQSWNLDETARVYDENPDKLYWKVIAFIAFPFIFLSTLLWGLKKFDSVAGAMSAGSAALIGYGTAGLVILGLVLGMIFSKSFRIVMLKVFLFILLLAAVIGAVAFFCF